MSTASCTSPPASISTLPASRLTRWASSALRAAITSAAAAISSARAGIGTSAQARWASAAAATASSMTDAGESGRTATTSLGRAGLTEVNVRSRHRQPTPADAISGRDRSGAAGGRASVVRPIHSAHAIGYVGGCNPRSTHSLSVTTVPGHGRRTHRRTPQRADAGRAPDRGHRAHQPAGRRLRDRRRRRPPGRHQRGDGRPVRHEARVQRLLGPPGGGAGRALPPAPARGRTHPGAPARARSSPRS